MVRVLVRDDDEHHATVVRHAVEEGFQRFEPSRRSADADYEGAGFGSGGVALGASLRRWRRFQASRRGFVRRLRFASPLGRHVYPRPWRHVSLQTRTNVNWHGLLVSFPRLAQHCALRAYSRRMPGAVMTLD